ncbi:Uncharacterised protein g2341 [Pycnogonum litorale]
MVSCGSNILKCLLFFFNFIFFISGCGIIAVGVTVERNYERFLGFLGKDFSSPPVMMIVVGVIVAVIAFFGCCGAFKENYCMTMTYSALLGVVLIMELAAGSSAYVLRGDLEKIVQERMLDSMAHYDPNATITVTKTWDLIQSDLNCCGLFGFQDWKMQTIYANNSDLPDSCCKSYSHECGVGLMENLNDSYITGCYKKFLTGAEGNIVTIGAVGIGIAFIQVIGILFACCFARELKSGYEQVV